MIVAFVPNRYSMLTFPKKCQPRIVENAKKNRQTATSEEMPAEDRGKCKEEQADCYEDISKSAEAACKCGLRQGSPCLSAVQNSGSQDGEYGQVQYDKSIDEYADHGCKPLLMRVLYICPGVCMRSGTHTCLVREKTSCDTIPDCFPDCDSGACSEYSLRVESADENHPERIREFADVHENQNKTSYNVDPGHQRNKFFNHGCESVDSTQKDKSGNCGKDDSEDDLRYVDSSCLEYLIECAADRIGLHHISGEAKGDDDQYGEDSGQHSAELSLKCSADIINRTTCHLSVFCCLILLGKSCLCVDRGHAEECAHPHPEDGARTSADQSGCSFSELSYLNEFQANGVVDPGAAKYDDEHHIPQKVTRLTYKLC